MSSTVRACVGWAVLILLAGSAAAQMPKPAAAIAAASSPAQGTLHVTRSSILAIDQGWRTLVISGMIGGVKVELMTGYGKFGKTWIVKPGDYPVTLKSQDDSDGKLQRTYAVELAPGKTVTFELTGMQE